MSVPHVNYFFNIIDNGIGIDKKYHYKIFRSFSHIDSSNTKSYSGTGLGLVNSKNWFLF